MDDEYNDDKYLDDDYSDEREFRRGRRQRYHKYRRLFILWPILLIIILIAFLTSFLLGINTGRLFLPVIIIILIISLLFRIIIFRPRRRYER